LKEEQEEQKTKKKKIIMKLEIERGRKCKDRRKLGGGKEGK
jgi:hypothetical protein